MTPLGSRPRTSRATPFIASIDSNGPPNVTTSMPGATAAALAASSAALGIADPAPARARRFASRSSSWRAATRSGSDSIDVAPATPPARWSSSRRAPTQASAPSPVSASIRRMPEPMLRSLVIRKPPIWPDARQWVPPHSSWL